VQKLLHSASAAGVPQRWSSDNPLSSPPLLEVFWRRRWILAASVGASLLIAVLYLLLSTPIYRSSARVLFDRTAGPVHTDSSRFVPPPENFVQTQVDQILSTAVLRRALEAVEYQSLKTFEGLANDPVAWLQRGNGLSAEVVRRSDIIEISMESAHPEEAAGLVNAVLESYMAEQARQRREAGQQMLAALEDEKQQVDARRDECVARMIEAQQRSGVMSFREDRGNTVLDRTVTLSDSLTSAELALFELQARQQAINEALADPAQRSAFVQAQLLKGRDSGDREYDELRGQLMQSMLALSTTMVFQGEGNKNVQGLQARLQSLRAQMQAKEELIAQAHLVELQTQLSAAAEQQRQVREALALQQGRAMALTPHAAEHARLAADVERLQKQSEQLANRIVEISVNNMKDVPLGMRVLEPARVETKPIRPKKSLVLLAALMVGCISGIGMVMVREWQDVRLRSPDEIIALLGTPVVAMVPRINPRLSPVTRGQLVRLDARSPVAEAYRSVRTSLCLGSAAKARTILLASPAPGDGKSTTASNLAIAFAQAGERTLIIDCDLREPVQHLIFEIDGSTGLSSVLSGEAKLRDAVQATRVPGLYVLPCGPVPHDPSEQLASKRFAQLMRALGSTFDRIIIDSPPVMSVTDARILAASSDVTLLVLRMNRSMRQLGAYALDGLERIGANVLGAIANDVPAGSAYEYYGGSWQYAATSTRLLDVEGVGGWKNTDLPVAAGNGEAAAAKSEHDVLTIEEPDWGEART
jgi:polysaccharide biosynthesis transport protein